MTIASNLQRIINAKAAIKAAIIEKGVEVPDDEKVDEYYSYIDQINTGPGYDPDNPTLEGLKAALDAGDYDAFPVGTEIPDTYNGHDSPLIVAQYLDSSNNESYGYIDGAFLVRKYVEPTSKVFASTGSSDYPTSTIKNFLDTEYYNNCSEELKGLITQFDLPYQYTTVPSKWFLMSDVEVNAATWNHPAFAYWKQMTNLATPSVNANAGRKVESVGTGQVVSWWLRSASGTNKVYNVSTNGSVAAINASSTSGVLPACFIASHKSGDEPDIFEPDLSQPLDEVQLENLQNIVATGKPNKYLQTGQELLVSYGEYTMPFEIVGFRSVELESGETVPAINLLAKYTSETDSQWGASGYTKYSESILRSSVMTVQNNLDVDFVACLANTKTQTYSRDGSTDVVYDKLFAPSMAQLGVTDASFNNANQAAVEGPVFNYYWASTATKRIKRAVNATGTDKLYWTRSLYYSESGRFGYITSLGSPGIHGTYNSNYRVVAACNFIAKGGN